MKIVLAVIIVLAIVCGGILCFYDIKSNIGGYDILLVERTNRNQGYGLNYKKSFEFWQFGENQHGGVAEMRIFPK